MTAVAAAAAAAAAIVACELALVEGEPTAAATAAAIEGALLVLALGSAVAVIGDDVAAGEADTRGSVVGGAESSG